jgi:WD40 repeat protein
LRSSAETPVDYVDFSPDGRLIALSTNDFTTLKIWNWRDGSQKFVEVPELGIRDIRFSPAGRYIAAGVDSGNVLIWNVRTGHLVEKLMGHRDRVKSVAFTPDGTRLVSGSVDQTCKVWDLGHLFAMDGSGSLQAGRIEDNSIGKEILNFNHNGSKVCPICFHVR